MILTGSEIEKEIQSGNIVIDPYETGKLNPNSVNLRLDRTLYRLQNVELDMKKESPYEKIDIPDEGLILQPGVFYLGRTYEYTETRRHVPMLEGRSSIGRLGIFVHVTAGFGDVGFKGFWTLEISVILPVRIYPFSEICQIYYNELKGEITEYQGKYQNNQEIQASRIFREFS